MFLKLGMLHWGLKLYKAYINDDPGLTLTYFTCFCTYSRPRYKVSVYRTIGPLVIDSRKGAPPKACSKQSFADHDSNQAYV